jgi:hypothetical protein
VNSDRTPLHIEVSYTLRAWEWVWATSGLRPMTLVYDTVAAALLLLLGIWEADTAYFLVLWGLSLLALTSYFWMPLLAGVISGGLRRATTPAELTIADTAVTATTARGRVVTEWDAVKTLREARGCLAILQFSGRYRLVPLRAFTTEQLDRLWAFADAEGYIDRRTFLEKLGLIRHDQD